MDGGIYIFILIAAVVIGAAIFNHHKEKQRREALKLVSEKMGFQFYPKPAVHSLGLQSGFYLFEKGKSPRVDNLFEKTEGNREDSIFGYRYAIGGGKNRTVHWQTVACFATNQSVFPDFDLRPEYIYHSLGNLFGYQDIDFPENQGFSSRYVLRGKDEEKIRNLFSADVLQFFEQKVPFSVEARSNQMIIYREGSRVEPEKIEAFYQEALNTYDFICRYIPDDKESVSNLVG